MTTYLSVLCSIMGKVSVACPLPHLIHPCRLPAHQHLAGSPTWWLLKPRKVDPKGLEKSGRLFWFPCIREKTLTTLTAYGAVFDEPAGYCCPYRNKHQTTNITNNKQYPTNIRNNKQPTSNNKQWLSKGAQLFCMKSVRCDLSCCCRDSRVITFSQTDQGEISLSGRPSFHNAFLTEMY